MICPQKKKLQCKLCERQTQDSNKRQNVHCFLFCFFNLFQTPLHFLIDTEMGLSRCKGVDNSIPEKTKKKKKKEEEEEKRDLRDTNKAKFFQKEKQKEIFFCKEGFVAQKTQSKKQKAILKKKGK